MDSLAVSGVSPFGRELSPLARWRFRSRAGGVIDVVELGAGAFLVGLPLLASAVSWPADDVLIGPRDLEHAAGFVLLPTWLWALASCATSVDLRGARGAKWPSPWRRPTCRGPIFLCSFVALV